eukprot:TRINITY_DN9984_c0_g1_i4.p1 TRINITY_DN9984_c0_g1~~TRINITY_DN9984_c0_g1_i4.p1  ORF type:complete len:988 (-),score=283.00 TRINITY_DN9984_c0_g1_i4:102-3065(-)
MDLPPRGDDSPCVVILGGDAARPLPRVLECPPGIQIRQVVAGGADDKLVGGLLTPDGQFYQWRTNLPEKRQVNTMSQVERVSLVRFPEPDTYILEVAFGTMHMLALARGGHVFSWGSGANGQLGHGTTESLSSPLLIRSLEEKGVCQIAAGGAHSAGLCDNGNLYMWGWNNSGQLGLEDVELRKIPTHATLFDDLEVSQVSCGLSHTAVLSRAERTVYTCGWNQYNQLGTGALWATRSEIPCKVDTLCGKGVQQVGCGGSNTVALCDTGEVFVWGWGEQGQLGLGSTTMCRYPTLVEELSDKSVSELSICGSHTAALTRSGELYTWGASTNGQLGLDGATAIYTTPQKVEHFNNDTVNVMALSGGIRAGQTVLLVKKGRSGTGSYQPLAVPPPAPRNNTEASDLSGSSKSGKSSPKKSERKPAVSTGSGRTKMKEAIRAMEASVFSTQEKLEKHRTSQQGLIEQKKQTAMKVVGLLGKMALCEEPNEAARIEKECGKLEKDMTKLSKKFFDLDQTCADLENETLSQRKELLRSLQSMQSQQGAQAVRRKDAMKEQLADSNSAQKKLQKQLDALEKELEPVTKEYMDAQALVESENSSTIAECRRQQAFLNELESSYSGLLEDIERLNVELAKKQNELRECDECMVQVREEIGKTEVTLQQHPARETMKDCETRGKGLREEADGVKQSLEKVAKEAEKMQEAQDEFQNWLDHVETVIKDTEMEVGKQKQAIKQANSARAHAKSVLNAQQGGEGEASAGRQESVAAALQQAQANAQQLQVKDHELQQRMQELENRVATKSAELSQLHTAKAAAVTSKQFKQATQLSQQIRQITEQEQADGDELTTLMEAAELHRAELSEAERMVDQQTLELMALEQEASASVGANQDQPPGCESLQQAASMAAASKCAEMSRFLELEVAALLAGAQAAQGYPPEEWQSKFDVPVTSAAYSDSFDSFEPTTVTEKQAEKEESSSSSDDSSSSSSDDEPLI